MHLRTHARTVDQRLANWEGGTQKDEAGRRRACSERNPKGKSMNNDGQGRAGQGRGSSIVYPATWCRRACRRSSRCAASHSPRGGCGRRALMLRTEERRSRTARTHPGLGSCCGCWSLGPRPAAKAIIIRGGQGKGCLLPPSLVFGARGGASPAARVPPLRACMY